MKSLQNLISALDKYIYSTLSLKNSSKMTTTQVPEFKQAASLEAKQFSHTHTHTPGSNSTSVSTQYQHICISLEYMNIPIYMYINI